jgi:hypothetical protein
MDIGWDQDEITFTLGLNISHNWNDDTMVISEEKLLGEAMACCLQLLATLSSGLTLTSITAHPPLTLDDESQSRSMVATLPYIETMTRPDSCYDGSTVDRPHLRKNGYCHPGALP